MLARLEADLAWTGLDGILGRAGESVQSSAWTEFLLDWTGCLLDWTEFLLDWKPVSPGLDWTEFWGAPENRSSPVPGLNSF